MRRSPLVVVALLAGSALRLPAQQPARAPGPPAAIPAAAGEVRGTVTEADGNTPLARATITVRARRDSALVAGAIAGRDGYVPHPGAAAGAYLLRVACIGFAPRVQDVAITAAAPRAASASPSSRPSAGRSPP